MKLVEIRNETILSLQLQTDRKNLLDAMKTDSSPVLLYMSAEIDNMKELKNTQVEVWFHYLSRTNAKTVLV